MTTFDFRLDADGTGCAAVPLEAFLAFAATTAHAEIEQALRAAVELVGIRYVDSDGRSAGVSSPGGYALVGFQLRSSELAEPDRCS